MAQINVYEAKTTLSRLIERARQGEEIVIARAGIPMVRLVPVDPTPAPRRLGIWEGRVTMASDWDDAAVNNEIAGMFDDEGAPQLSGPPRH